MVLTRYQISLHAEKLPRSFLRKPNPYAEIAITGGPKEGTSIGKTESVQKSMNPDWVRCLFVETDPSVFMPIKVSIYDDRGIGNDNVLLAETSFEVTEIYQNPGHTQSVKKGKSKIYVSVEESVKGDSKGTFTLQLRGLDLKNVEPGLLGLGRSDPFYELAKKNSDPSTGYVRWNVVHRSEVFHDHLNPYWKAVTFSLEELCYCDLQCPLKVTVYDHESNGRHRVIGSFETNVPTLMDRISIRGNADRGRAIKITDDEIDTQNKNLDETKNRGLIVVVQADLLLDKKDQ